MTLDGKTALITGAGRGIGRALAVGLAEAGVSSTVLVARTEPQLAETAELVTATGGACLPVVADLADPAAVAAVVERVRAELGRLDILVNNAGSVEPLGPSTGMDPAVWAGSFGINVFAPAALSFALLPAMVEAGWGRIANVSSGIVAHPGALVGGNAYAATKGALEAHTLNLATELAGTGVTVNVYRPGEVDTAMQGLIRTEGAGRVSEATHNRFLRNQSEGRLMTPEASATALLERLGSDESGQIWDPWSPR